MFANSKPFSSFAVNDLDVARAFYEGVLEIEIETVDMRPDGPELLQLNLGDAKVMVYPKGDAHEPANFTVLNFPVEDLEAAVDELSKRGVNFERYDNFPHDEKGIVRGGGGPAVAWFKDPSGNTIAVMKR